MASGKCEESRMKQQNTTTEVPWVRHGRIRMDPAGKAGWILDGEMVKMNAKMGNHGVLVDTVMKKQSGINEPVRVR